MDETAGGMTIELILDQLETVAAENWLLWQLVTELVAARLAAHPAPMEALGLWYERISRRLDADDAGSLEERGEEATDASVARRRKVEEMRSAVLALVRRAPFADDPEFPGNA